MFDDATGNVDPTVLDCVEHESHLAVVVEVLKLLVRYGRDLHVEGALREQRVAVPAGADLLFGLRNIFSGPDSVNQADKPDVGPGARQADGTGVGQGPTQ